MISKVRKSPRIKSTISKPTPKKSPSPKKEKANVTPKKKKKV